MNSANMVARIRGMDMFNAVAALVMLERARFIKHQTDAENLRHVFTDFARIKYAEMETKSSTVVANVQTDFRRIVKSLLTRKTYQVEMKNDNDSPGGLFGSCSCGTSLIDYLPCEHMVAFARQKGYSEHKIVPIEYQSRRYRTQYPVSLKFEAICKDEAKHADADTKLFLAPEFPRQPGRPRKRRIQPAIERNKRTRINLCSICKSRGHNAATCPQAGQPHEKEERCSD